MTTSDAGGSVPGAVTGLLPAAPGVPSVPHATIPGIDQLSSVGRVDEASIERIAAALHGALRGALGSGESAVGAAGTAPSLAGISAGAGIPAVPSVPRPALPGVEHLSSAGSVDEAGVERIAAVPHGVPRGVADGGAAAPGAAGTAPSLAGISAAGGVPAAPAAPALPTLHASSLFPFGLDAGLPRLFGEAALGVPVSVPASPVTADAPSHSFLPSTGSAPRPQAATPLAGVWPGAGIPSVPRPALPGIEHLSSAGAGIPAVPGLPATTSLPALDASSLSPSGLDAGLPRLFEDAALGVPVSVPGSPATADVPSYYFLSSAAPEPRPQAATPLAVRRPFEVRDFRRDFPILQERIHGHQLVWLDNAATTQKPSAVINRIVHYYEHEYSNVHRGAHTLAARSTDAYEAAREKIQRFIGAGSPSEIVFVRGTTEAVNLVAGSWGKRHIGEGDEIVLTTLEHHSNIVPWQLLAEQTGALLRVVPVTDRGEVLLDDYEKLLGDRTKLVAVTHVSNALGTILPIRDIVQSAHRYGARVLVDGAQAVSHFPVNVQALDADFYAFSGHKMFGPTGVGVLYGKKAILDQMPPWQGGGNMIQRVTFEKSTFADPPARFEAGTGTLGPAVGLGAAVDYLEQIGMDNVSRHEHDLLVHGTDALSRIPGVTLIGTAPEKAGVLSFIADGITAEEMGSALDQEGIAVRAGHHCAQPTMDRFGVESTVRPSLALYNTHDEIDLLARAVRRILRR